MEGLIVGDVVNLAIPVLGGLCLLAALVFVLRAVVERGQASHRAYAVGRQEARRAMQMDFVRGAFFLLVGLVLMGVYGFRPGAIPFLASPIPTATLTPAASATAAPSRTGTATLTATVAVPASLTPVATPTSPLPTPAPTATDTPASTAAMTATVNSEVGLYLREAPGGTQELELLAHETVLILLPGREFAEDGSEWQEVRTPSGNEGWVAVDFIIYQP